MTDLKAQQVDAISAKAMQFIIDNKLPATPEMYEFWYGYASGLEPALSSRIDRILQRGIAITLQECDELYKEFFSNQSEVDLVRETGRKMQKAIQQVTELLQSAGGSSAEYSTSLLKHADTMQNISSINDLKTMVNFLIEDTRLMVDKNRELQGRLAESSNQMTQMRSNLEEVQKEAVTDSLTGLPNRRFFERTIREHAARVLEDPARALSLVMVDIDHFKVFNDNYGHQVGDQVLRLVASALRESIRGRDLPARFGGEEFCVILPDTTLNGAGQVAENIRETIAAKDIINQTKGESLGRLTVSAGVTQFSPGETASGFVNRADRALYRAKDMGRNQVVKISYERELEPRGEEEENKIIAKST